jgi:hypothetical protein
LYSFDECKTVLKLYVVKLKGKDSEAICKVEQMWVNCNKRYIFLNEMQLVEVMSWFSGNCRQTWINTKDAPCKYN